MPILRVKHVVTGPFQENSYVATCTATGEAILVDPGDDADDIAALVTAEGATPKAIWLTHTHLDHVGAVRALQDRYGIPAYAPDGDQGWLDALELQAQMFGVEPPPPPRIDGPVVDGARIAIGQVEGRVLATPGHTEGGSCFYFEAARTLFVGDTLFVGSVGRTDLPGGDWTTLSASIRERLFVLPDDVTFHPGHGPYGTIGEEKRSNPFVGAAAVERPRARRMP